MGTVETQIRIVKTVEAVDNPARSSCSYRIASEELYHILTDGEERGESLVGFYHSYPCWGAEPSKLDLELASFPEVSYLIYSVRDLN
jgi:proteasome lid subunit RPN8/RPN11